MIRRLAVAAVVIACALVGAASPGYADNATLSVSGLRTSAGQVEFFLSARDLPDGPPFAGATVEVSAGGTALDAKATPVTAGASAPKRAAVLVIDVSGSMKGARLASAKTAALAFLAALPADVAVGLVAVSTTPRTVVAPTADRAAVTAGVKGLTAGGRTALYDGVAVAVHTLTGRADDRRIVLLTDGEDSASTASVAAVTLAAAAAGDAVDTVGFLTGRAAQRVLAGLSGGTGGRVYTAADDTELAGAFRSAAGWFGAQLDVTVTVPPALSGADGRLEITAHATGWTVSASTPVRFALDPRAPVARTVVPASPVSRVALPVVAAIVFAALLLVGLVVFAPFIDYTRHRRRIAQIGQYTAAPAAPSADGGAGGSLKRSALAATEAMVRSRGLDGRISLRLDSAGIRLRPHEWVLLRTVLTVVLAFLLTLVTNIAFGVIGALVLGLGGTAVYRRMRTDSRRRAFAAGLPDALQLVIGSLRSGFSLSQAVQAMAREVGEPLGAEFGRALAETRLGVEIEDALSRLADRVGSTDLAWVVVAVTVQREVGGNLAEVLGRTVETMREREAMRGQVRALAAEGKLSAWILVALPMIIGVYMLLVRPSYVRPLYTQPAGIAMVLVGAGLLAVGGFWMSRAVRVEV